MSKKMRNWLNQNSAVVTIGAVMLLVLALAAIVVQMRPPSVGGPVEIWYYDLNTSELFTAKSDQLPPTDAPSDGTGADTNPTIPAGVRAYVYSCGDCDNPADRIIAWLEMYPPEVKERIEAMMKNPGSVPPDQTMMEDPMSMGTLIRGIKSENWVPQYSEQGMKVQQDMGAAMRCPDGSPPKWCQPGR